MSSGVLVRLHEDRGASRRLNRTDVCLLPVSVEQLIELVVVDAMRALDLPI